MGRPQDAMASLERVSALKAADAEVLSRLVYYRALLSGRAPARAAWTRLSNLTAGWKDHDAWIKRGDESLAWGLSGGGDMVGAVDVFEAMQMRDGSKSLTIVLSNHREWLSSYPPHQFGLSAGAVLGSTSRVLSVDGGFGNLYLSLGFENRFRLTAGYGFTGLLYDTNTVSFRTNITPRQPPGPGGLVTNITRTTNWIPRVQHEFLLSGTFSAAAPWYREATLGAKALLTGGTAASNLYSGFLSAGAVWGAFTPRVALSTTWGPLVHMFQGTASLQARFGVFQPGFSGSVIQALSKDPMAAPLPDTQWSGSLWFRIAQPVSPKIAFELGADVGGRRYFLSPDGFETVLVDENPIATARASLWFPIGDGNAMRLTWKQAFGPNPATAYGVFHLGLEVPFGAGTRGSGER